MNQLKIYENEKHKITVRVSKTDYFGLFIVILRDGLFAFEGQTTQAYLDRMIQDLELTEKKEYWRVHRK